MDILVNQLIDEALANVDITVVVALMALGFIIKHFKFLEKFDNNFIPPLLLLCSIIIVVLTDGFTVPSIISAIVNAAVAVGLHQQGKNIFTVTIVPTITSFFKNLTVKTEEVEEEVIEEEEAIVEEYEESVDEVVEEEDTDI